MFTLREINDNSTQEILDHSNQISNVLNYTWRVISNHPLSLFNFLPFFSFVHTPVSWFHILLSPHQPSRQALRPPSQNTMKSIGSIFSDRFHGKRQHWWSFYFFFFVVQVNQKAEPICPQLIQLWDLCAVNPCSPMPNVMLTASLCSHSKVLQTSGNSHSGHPIWNM